MNKVKTILIIGANSDIAIAIAHKFASQGYHLQLASRNISDLSLSAEDLKIRYQISVSIYKLDILDYGYFTTFIQSLNVLPDIALCAVGILGNQKNDEKSVLNSSLIMKTNFEGPSLFLGEIANFFEERGYGSIIGISSVAGDRGRASNYIYGSAKAGFSAFLSGLRNRLHKSKIKVLTIRPGFVRTKMTRDLNLPNLITAKPKDVANYIYKVRNKSINKALFPWNYIMFIIKNIPEILFKNLNL